MRRKEVLFAVIGGIVGAVLVMATGSFSPLGAQNEAVDLHVGEITCTGLKVVDEEGVLRVGLMDEGIASVLDKDGKDGKAKVAMTVDENRGHVVVYGKNAESKASMGVDDYGNGAVSTWDKNG